MPKKTAKRRPRTMNKPKTQTRAVEYGRRKKAARGDYAPVVYLGKKHPATGGVVRKPTAKMPVSGFRKKKKKKAMKYK